MKFEKLFYFPIPKLLIIQDIRLGVLNRFIQFGIFIFVLVNLSYYELYYKTETPKGYITSMWSERKNLYEIQRQYSNLNKSNKGMITKFNYCDNSKYNYIYELPYWDYRNVSCINLPYSEMYEKGEQEFFFLTMFHENHINLYNCKHPDYINLNNTEDKKECLINDRLDGNCLCQNYKNYFTVGIEEMLFSFDYKYLTSFKKGGNVDDKNGGSVKTELYDINQNYNRTYNTNENIGLTIKDWLQIADINLEDINYATRLSKLENGTEKVHSKFRMSGIEILLKIECSNFKTFTNMNYGDTLCKIKPYINEGWASKGSMINYIKYPDLNDKYINAIYYDRYRYGIKFKFLFTGNIGEFHYNNFINTLLSGVVLFGTSATIILLILTNFFHGYMKNINNISLTPFKQKNYNTCKKFCKGICCNKKKNIIENIEENIENKNIIENIENKNIIENIENIRIAIV